MGDAIKDWTMRKNESLYGPYTEYELRRKLIVSNITHWEVKQGASEWFPATVVLQKFKELARAGIYLRWTRDHSRRGLDSDG